MSRVRLLATLVLTVAALVAPATAASAKPDLCDYVQNVYCDVLP